MERIILITETEPKKSFEAVLTTEQVEKLEILKFNGGFLRFDIDLYEDGLPIQVSKINSVLIWLINNVFIGSSLEEITTEFNNIKS